jgi:hypothetical protein
MKMILKSAFAVAAMASAAVMVPGAASAAAVGVSIGVAVPAPVVVVSPYGPGYVAYDEQYYYDPIYISGSWYHGPYRWKMRHGERMFFVNGRWHRNEWRDNTFPATITFYNGGHYAAGRYDGFGDAERINARFHAGKPGMNSDRHEDAQDAHPNHDAHAKQNAQHDQNEHHDGGDDAHN